MNQESLQRIDGFLAASAIDLFASHGLEVEPGQAAYGGIEDPIAATIGFTAEEMHGVLVLTICRELAEMSLPGNLKIGGMDDAILADWTGELSNQMLGRLKNRFHASGVDIALSTPCVFVGKEMKHYSHVSPIQRLLHLDSGRILVELHADIERDFEIGEERDAGKTGPIEGEVFFF